MEASQDDHSGREQPILIWRSPAPDWEDLAARRSSHLEKDAAYDAFGEQAEWGFAIPWVHRALASPLTYEPILEAPRPGAMETKGPVAYWSSLLHFLVYGLGWVRPDRGMHWWYESGKPTTDRNLQFISQVWSADGQLDWFAAWLWSTPRVLAADLLNEATGYILDDYAPLPPSDQWLQDQISTAMKSSISAPVGGGWDPHHLSAHINGPIEPAEGGKLLVRTGPTRRQAILLLDSMIGWYRALATETSSLPKLSGHSWRVDVVVKPAGWLGTYRKSGVTGLWFTGRHSVHMHGV